MEQAEVKEMPRMPISITLPKQCIEWIDRRVESRVHANRSHALEVLILEAMKNEKKEPHVRFLGEKKE